MSQILARLVVRRGPNPNETFDLSEAQISIGRSPANGIPIVDPEISRKHAQLVQQGDGYALEDLGSTNGSFVNGRRITGLTPLHHGDIIELGEAINLVYLVGPLDSEATMVDAGRHFNFEQTPPMSEVAPPSAPPPVYEAVPVPPVEPFEAAAPKGASCRRRLLLGCGGLLLLLFLCVATFYFLDAYEQGRLLYCGPLRPFWQLVLGPFGFAPVCP